MIKNGRFERESEQKKERSDGYLLCMAYFFVSVP